MASLASLSSSGGSIGGLVRFATRVRARNAKALSFRLTPTISLASGSTTREQASWPLLYDQRAGIQVPLWQGVRGFGMPHRRTGRSRYIGLAKTHLQPIFVAPAMKLWRIIDWLNEVPLAKTRQSAFVHLFSQNYATA